MPAVAAGCGAVPALSGAVPKSAVVNSTGSMQFNNQRYQIAVEPYKIAK
jgi:hypothetical protein